MAWRWRGRLRHVRSGRQCQLSDTLDGSGLLRWFEAFQRGLNDLGYVHGRTVAIEVRDAAGQAELLPKLAAELVRIQPDVIVASGSPAAIAARNVTTTIPIVFTFATDPDVNFRGVGEGGMIIAPAVIVNAIEDALAPFGVRIEEQHPPPSRIVELVGSVAPR